MANILLINPPFLNSKFRLWEPTPLLLLAACLRKSGHIIYFCDLNFESMNKIKKIILENAVETVIFNNITAQINGAYSVAKLLRHFNPRLTIIYTGPHVTFLPQEPFLLGNADYVIRGEVELAVPQLFANRNKTTIKGVLDNSTRHNSTIAELPMVLDDLPFPAYDLIGQRRYDNDIHVLPYAFEQAINVILSRGCPFACEYCQPIAFEGHQLRMRSPDSSIEEIKIIRDKYRYRFIHFMDNNFLLKYEFVESLCEKILKEKINVKWVAQTRLKEIVVNRSLVGLMHKAGCVGLEVGLQTASIKINTLSKRYDFHDKRDLNAAIKILQNHDIEPIIFQISFLPGETLDSAYATAMLIKKCMRDRASRIADNCEMSDCRPFAFGQFATPHVGTPFFNSSQQTGRVLAQNWDDYSHGKVNYLPFSFLEDIPVQKRKFDTRLIYENEGIIENYLNRRKKLGKYWIQFIRPYTLLNRLTLGWLGKRIFNTYLKYLYEIFNLADGKRTVREITKLSSQKLIPACLAIRWLAMFGLIKSHAKQPSASKIKKVKVAVSIIIPAFNNRAIIRKTIDSISPAINDLKYEIIVVDNGSSDGTSEIIENAYRNVILIKLSYNRGSTVAKNLAIKKASGEFIFTMDSDVILKKDAIKKMHDILYRKPNLAGISGDLINQKSQTINQELTYRKFIDVFKHLWIIERIRIPARIKSLEPKKNWAEYWYHDTDVPFECAMLIRKTALQDIGFLDENLKIYYATHDWTRRAKLNGWGIGHSDEIVNIHIKHETLRPYSYLSRQQWEDAQYFIEKNLGPITGLLNLFLNIIEAAGFILVFKAYYYIFQKSDTLKIIDFAKARLNWSLARLFKKHQATPWGKYLQP